MLLHALIPASRANGPGQRTVVFFQGCKLGCVGCWNPRSHHFHGAEIKVDAVAQEVLRSRQKHTLEGVTFSGGEPMQQAGSLLGLMHSLRRQVPELSFGMFSGYAEHELAKGRYWIWGDGSSEQHRKRLW
jgi:anaerobic ribonucleoside-triphosphate reductase activating protein